MRGRSLGAIFVLLASASAADQIAIPYLEPLPRLPSPLILRDWRVVSREYYRAVFDTTLGPGGFPRAGWTASGKTFGFGSYVDGTIHASGEAMAGIAPVIGGLLAGLDMRDVQGRDYVQASKRWYDPGLGLYRNTPGQTGNVVHGDIYGYWPAMLGIMLGSFFPEDSGFRSQLATTARRFREIAAGSGCPERPDFRTLGFDFAKQAPGGRNEPMNRLGNASSVAWVNFAGWATLADTANLAAAECALAWHAANPGRYEVTHLPGPLVAARLNAELGRKHDVARMIRTWLGDCPEADCPWKVTVGAAPGGLTADGLDAARFGGTQDGFYAFTMGTLQGPAWLVPVARYDTRFARAIGRYALHATASVRLLQGYGLDWEHQDHKDWKNAHDPKSLLFYEGLASRDWADQGHVPYATGDPVRLGWTGRPAVPDSEYAAQKAEWIAEDSRNLAVYMGNHVGFLGGIVSATGAEGILAWDCLKTDWFHPPAWPTRLIFNPHADARTVGLDVGGEPVDLYDAAGHRWLAYGKTGAFNLRLPADAALVIVAVPAGESATAKGGKLWVKGRVIDYRSAVATRLAAPREKRLDPRARASSGRDAGGRKRSKSGFFLY